jgi:two-component system chemotaxis response regulator CheY
MKNEDTSAILVVEDQPDVATVLRNSLRELGYKDVVIATTGQRALDKLSERRFALIMADLTMQPMSGFDLIAMIRRDKKLRDLPVVAVSGRGDPDSVLEAKKAGATAFLLKPYSMASLKSKLAAALAVA